MNQTTNATAGIDLAQLDKLEALAQASLQAPTAIKAEQALSDFHDEANPAMVRKLIALARRSLTSGSPADALRAKCAEVLQSWDEQGTDRCLIAAVFRQKLDELAVLVAAPVHDAAAPSAEQAKELVTQYRTGYRHGYAEGKAELPEAGAAAKTDHALCPYCGGKDGAHDRAYPHPSKDYSASAAGAGSDQAVAAYLVRSPRTGKERFMSKSKRHLIDHWENSGYEVTPLTKFAPSTPSVTVQDERDAIEKLNEQLAAEKRKSLELQRVYDERGRQIGRLEIALERAAHPVQDGEKDALRYRWLRDKSEPGICAFYLSVGQAFKDVKFARETVDEAIDAQITAMAAAQKGGAA